MFKPTHGSDGDWRLSEFPVPIQIYYTAGINVNWTSREISRQCGGVGGDTLLLMGISNRCRVCKLFTRKSRTEEEGRNGVGACVW